MTSDVAQHGGWYITRDGGEMRGPLSDADMRRAIARGSVKPADHVWRDGMDEWVEAQQIPNYADVRREYDAALAHAATASRAQPEPEQTEVWGRKPVPTTRAGRRQKPAGKPRGKPDPRSATSRDDAKSSSQTTSPKLGNAELEKLFADLAKRVGTIPPGTIVFFALGFVFVPLLPVFWFIAWWMWSNAQKS